MDLTEITGYIACSECGHLHFAPRLGGGGHYVACPLANEGCDCPFPEEVSS
jgi:hypothetical protein